MRLAFNGTEFQLGKVKRVLGEQRVGVAIQPHE